MLPKAFDPDLLRTVALAALGLLVVLAFLVVRFFQKMVLRVILLGALAGLGVYVWSQKTELDSCRKTCACRVVGREVQVPGCPSLRTPLPGALAG